MAKNNRVRVAINGLGRIGRAFFKLALQRDDIEIAAVNDLGDAENMAYLLNYDSIYGPSGLQVKSKGDSLEVKGCDIRYLSEKEPAKLPWKELGIDVVVESTGFFTSYKKAVAHISAGARRVVISAPAKDAEGETEKAETVLLGVNEERFGACPVTSNASCTTNAASSIIAILDESIGIEKATLNTVHAYTASQSLVDGPAGKRGMREGRAAAQNIVPSSTGAAIAVTKAFTKLEGLFDGVS